MSETAKVNLVIDTGFVGGVHYQEHDTGIEKDVWASMSEDEKLDYLDDDLNDFRENSISTYFEEIE